MNQKVLLETTKGNIIIELFPEHAPITVENFIELVGKGFYNGLTFHRVIKNFMIQGGCPQGTGMGGSEKQIKGEFTLNKVNNILKHTKGTISMARSMLMNSASSQFFICHTNTPHLDGQYAAFGQVVEGLDIVDAIASVDTDHRDKPREEVKIIKASLM